MGKYTHALRGGRGTRSRAMTQSPSSETPSGQPPEIETDRLISVVSEFLGSGRSANLAARALVEAEILEQPEFGLELLNERNAPGTPPRVQMVGEVGWIDALESFGPTSVAAAAIHTRSRAGEGGVGLCHVTGVGRLGRLATYATWGAEQGLISLVIADAPPAVIPAGGSTAVLGTNPLAVAMPGEPPLVVDFATAASTELRRRAPVGPIEPRGGLIGTLAGLTVAMLTGGISGCVPSRTNGRTVTVLMMVARSTEGTAAWVENLLEGFRLSGARIPGERSGGIIRSRSKVLIQASRWGPISEAIADL